MQRSATAITKIGRYDVVGLLATGGMAELFLARQTGPSGFERPVVIKRVLPHLARERAFYDMFLDEARLVVNIRHPNVVQVHELGTDRGELFLVMEYLEGESLAMLAKRLVQRGERLPDRAIVHVLAEACAGLHAAHELADGDRPLGLVHRDVSPHNLFVLYSGQIKVIDFGIAKAADRTSKTKTGTVKGKFAYMAPEQVRAEDVDRRADIFALGTVMHELLTGKPLFARDNDLLVMQALCIDPTPSPRAARPDVDPELERIAMKALSRSPDDRYPTAAAMRRDLVASLNRLNAASTTGELADEELAGVMRSTFVDRIAGKAEMLKRVRAGQALTQVVGSDTDSSAPALSPDVTSQGSGTASPAQVISIDRPAPPRRAWPLIAGGIALVAGGIGLGVIVSGRGAPEGVSQPLAAETQAAAAQTTTSSPSPEIVPVPSTSATTAASESAAAPSASVSSSAQAAAPPSKPRPAAPKPKPTSSPGFSRFD